MKTWIVILALLMPVGIAGADAVDIPDNTLCQYSGDSWTDPTHVTITCGEQTWEWQKANGDECLDKMQAAMEAMEQQFYYKHDGKMVFPFKAKGAPIPADVWPLIQQWQHVKEQCWR